MTDGRDELGEEVVQLLLAEQFPQWANLEIKEVEHQGWDNRTFRLGDDLSVRLPSAEGYEQQVDREHRWLPFLAERLRISIPSPVARGVPSPRFSRPWSVYRWLPGEPLIGAKAVDLDQLATDCASFLRSLEALPTPLDAPHPQPSNGFRGDAFRRYLAEGEAALAVLDATLRPRALEWMRTAASTTWDRAPVWVHGDMASGNLLTREGRLTAVIDFGCIAVGDPACDLTLAWTIFDEPSRERFRHDVGHDIDTWTRARGWAVWKAAITIQAAGTTSAKLTDAQRTIEELWRDDAW
jgi:aminoglycoside phosphotransferase (APT) family kinase protein